VALKVKAVAALRSATALQKLARIDERIFNRQSGFGEAEFGDDVGVAVVVAFVEEFGFALLEEA